MDGVSAAVGIIAFAAQATQAVTTLISQIRDAPDDIADLGVEVEDLSSMITSVGDLSARYGQRTGDDALLKTFSQCLKHCTDSVTPLETLLKPFAASGTGSGGRRNPLRIIMWTMRKGDINTLKLRLRDRTANLSIAIGVLNGYLAGKGQDEIRKDMIEQFDRLNSHFLNRENERLIRQQLEDDLTSVAAAEDGDPDPGLDGRTDAGFAMRKYLEQIEVATVPDEPPPIEELDETAFPVNDGDSLALNADRDVNSQRTLLQIVSSGDKAALLDLISKGASLTDRSPQNLTALHYCALYNDMQIAEVLLDHGIPINVKNDERVTAFELAVKEQSWDVAALLLERGCMLGKFTDAVFTFLREEDDISSARVFLSVLAWRLNASENGPCLIHMVLEKTDSRALKVLLEEGFDPNAKENRVQPIHQAILQNRLDDVALLVSHGASVNAYLPKIPRSQLRADVPRHKLVLDREDRDYTPLLLATGHPDQMPIFRFLLERGADPNQPLPVVGDIALSALCLAYFLPFAEALIRAGANVNFRDRDNGLSPLYWATMCRNPRLVQLLIDAGADVNVRTNPTPSPLNRGGVTPLDVARVGSEEHRLLLEGQARIREQAQINTRTDDEGADAEEYDKVSYFPY